ncbi:MAG: hypothetical protein RMJ98_12105 [Myxococcales bacterium]|nr:hypothetical protein [Polyangiaceae bacterium]MDW8250030.1 hypothetical protein [Myxococcales bacterium]
MVPFRKPTPLDEEVPPSSGPPTLRSARFEVARPLEVAHPHSEAPSSEEEYMPVLERSDVIQAVRPRMPPAANESDEIELSDEDLELFFDELILDLDEPDTERTVYLTDFGPGAEDHDTEPPPPTLRCSGV